MLPQVHRAIQSHNLLPEAGPVLIGVSGGVDSMVLLHVMHTLGYQVAVAHVNYNMRSASSDADEALVTAYCDQHGLSCTVHRVVDVLDTTDDSFQALARDTRYSFFEQVANEAGIHHVAVAHHQDDQAETLLLNLMRGSGADGLAGMPHSRQLGASANLHLIRPLLGVSREAIEGYALAHSIPWREDASNTSTKYLRNKVRHVLMPTILEIFGDGAVENMATSAGLLQGTVEHALQPLLQEKLNQIAESGHALDAKRLAQEPLFWQVRLVMEVCKKWFDDVSLGRQHAKAVCQLLDAQVGRKVVLGSVVVWRERDQLVFLKTPNGGEEAADLYFVDADAAVSYPGGQLDAKVVDASKIFVSAGENHQFFADVAALCFPLALRRWQAGDKMVPFGMAGQKKVSDLLTDLKIPSHEREDVWVLVSGDDIVWVVGHRAAEQVRVGPATEQVLCCTWRRR